MEIVENAVIDALVSRAKEIAHLAQLPPTPSDSPELQQLQTQLFSLKSIPGHNPAIQSAIATLESQITELRFSLSQNQNQDNVSRNLLLWAFKDPACWRLASNEDKKRVYRELVDKVLVKGGVVIEVKLKV